MSGNATMEVAAGAPSVRALTAQQFWLFGFDIRTSGNLLLRAGFERKRQGRGRPTRYTHQSERRTVALWGFGMLWLPSTAEHGVFLSRDGRSCSAAVERPPRLRHAWEASARLGLAPDGDPAILADAFRWIAEYEEWVRETAGPAHRRRALEDWEVCCRPGRIAAEWRSRARAIGAAADEAGLIPDRPDRRPATAGPAGVPAPRPAGSRR